MRFKWELTFFSILLIMLLSIAGCESDALGDKKYKSDEDCEFAARAQIPEKITLFQRAGSDDWAIKQFNWKDGTRIGEDYVQIEYKKGSQPGQNVMLYYPSSFFEDIFLTYSKQVIAEDGTILGTNTFQVMLILKPIPNTEGEYKVWETSEYPRYPTQDFEIVEVKFTSCNQTSK